MPPSNIVGTRYQVLRTLGSGGMGEVFLARDRASGKLCALKRLRSRTRSKAAALRHEFATLTRLRHPTIVSVYDFGVASDLTPFYTMEYVPGRSPDTLLKPGDWPSLLNVAIEIAQGLEVLHTEGVVHGDLKPSNVIAISHDSGPSSITNICLVDFGLSVALGDSGGAYRGTLGFAAPEVVRGEAPTAASDLYALGAMLFFLVSRRTPFHGETPDEMLTRQLADPADRAPLEQAGAPRALVDLVLQLLAPHTKERLPSARHVVRELQAIDPSVRRSMELRLGNATVAGRDLELARVERLLGRPLPQSRLLIVNGPPGGGKSAFLAEVASRATLAGHPVVRSGGLDPAALLTATAPSNGHASSWPVRALDQRLEANPTSEPHRFTVYVVDDGGGGGLSVRYLLDRLGHDPDGKPVLVVLAGTEAANDLRVLVDAGVAEVVRLPALAKDAVAELVTTRLRESPPPRLVDYLFERAQGHPGLTIEVLKTLVRTGALRETEAGIVLDGELLERLDIPTSFELSQRARFGELPAATRRALETLSILHGASLTELRLVDASVTSASLEFLREHGWVRESVGGQWQLTSPWFSVHGDAARLSGLHRAALSLPNLPTADRFRHLVGAGETNQAFQLALQDELSDPVLLSDAAELAAAQDAPLAARFHEQAARSLFAKGRYEAAVPNLESALRLDSISPGRRGERLYLLSSAFLRCGQADRAGEVIEEALHAHPPFGLRSRLLTNQSARLHGVGDLVGGEKVGREAIAAALSANDPEAEALAAQSLAYILLAVGRTDEAESMADRAILAGTHASTFVQVRAQGTRAAVLHRQHKLDLALGVYRSALEQARAGGLRVLQEELLINSSVVLTDLGKWEEVREANAEAVRLALEDHRPRNAAVAMANLAHGAALAGRPHAARRTARRAIKLARAYLPALESSAWRALAYAERAMGKTHRAQAAGRRARELAEARGSVDEIGWSALEHGRALEAGDRLEHALATWRTALRDLPAEAEALRCLVSAHAGSAASRLGRISEATEDLAFVRTLLERGNLPRYARAHALRFMAEAALREGSVEEGGSLASSALQAFEAMPALLDQAHAAILLAEAFPHHISGAFSSAFEQWLATALATFDRCGDHRASERALRVSVRWLRARPDGRRSKRGPHGLLEAVSELLASLPDLRELAERSMALVVEQLGAERGVFLVIDPETAQLRSIAELGNLDNQDRRAALGYSRQAARRVAASGTSLLVVDAPLDPRARSESVSKLQLRSILCVPLLSGERVLGVVYLDDARKTKAFDDTDRELVEGIANLLAVALERNFDQQTLVGENLTLRRQLTTRFRSDRLIGTSLAMQQVLALIDQVAATNSTVLITGESGTGKELVAEEIHHLSKRRLRPLVMVNCGAFTETLLESQLFGINKGVASGVDKRPGLFREAHTGTLFLDEIGDMPYKQQVSLFSTLNSKAVMPVGGEGQPIPVDVRIIAATNHDLQAMVQEGTFREELFYRLNVVPIALPPLRERKSDIPALAEHFARLIAAAQERSVPKLSPEFMGALMRSRWPGNIRQLRNYLEQIMAVTRGDVLYPRPLPPDLQKLGSQEVESSGPLAEQLEALERCLLEKALLRSGGNQSLAARELGLTEPGMRFRMRKVGLVPRQKRRVVTKARPAGNRGPLKA